jgi:hypothetical protein
MTKEEHIAYWLKIAENTHLNLSEEQKQFLIDPTRFNQIV